MPKPKQKHSIQKPVTMRLPKRSYQPSRKELREEVEMPGLSLDQARKAFFRPFKFESDLTSRCEECK